MTLYTISLTQLLHMYPMSSKQYNRFFDLFDPEPEEICPEYIFHRSGQQTAAMRKFHARIDYEIDFHGLNINDTIMKMNEHINTHTESHICLLIHGKAYQTGSKLKKALLAHLASVHRCYGYLPATIKYGGEGATIARFSKK